MQVEFPFELKAFKPHAGFFTGMNQINVVTEDTSLVTGWHGLLHIELLKDFKGVLRGFHLVNAKGLMGRPVLKFTPLLLVRALWRDLRNQAEHQKPLSVVRALYRQAFALTLKFPRTWWVSL